MALSATVLDISNMCNCYKMTELETKEKIENTNSIGIKLLLTSFIYEKERRA